MANGKKLSIEVLNKPLVSSDPLAAIDTFFLQQGMEEWSIRSKPDHKTILVRTKDGNSVRYSVYAPAAFRETTLSNCGGLPPTRRKAIAKRFSKKGFTQTEIAERLRCSQKPVSNDLL